MLGKKIKELRMKKGLSQEELSKELNVVRQTISKWEKGYSLPDVEMLHKLANVFSVSTNELLNTNDANEITDNNVIEQLTQLNDKLNKMNNIRQKWTKTIINIVICTIVILVIAEIWEPWCNMWHEFGENIYNLFNK